MPIPESEVRPGRYFYAGNKQLRKVLTVKKDKAGRKRVSYLAKSGRIPEQKFGYGSTKTNPPLLTTFSKKCTSRLNDSEISRLRKAVILLTDE